MKIKHEKRSIMDLVLARFAGCPLVDGLSSSIGITSSSSSSELAGSEKHTQITRICLTTYVVTRRRRKEYNRKPNSHKKNYGKKRRALYAPKHVQRLCV